MSTSTLGLGESLQQYLLDVSLHEPEACLRLREQTLSMPEANMISSPEQVQLLELLCKMLNAKRGISAMARMVEILPKLSSELLTGERSIYGTGSFGFGIIGGFTYA